MGTQIIDLSIHHQLPGSIGPLQAAHSPQGIPGSDRPRTRQVEEADLSWEPGDTRAVSKCLASPEVQGQLPAWGTRLPAGHRILGPPAGVQSDTEAQR